MIHQLLVAMAGYRSNLTEKVPDDLWSRSEKSMVLQSEKMGELNHHVVETVRKIQDSTISVTTVGHSIAKAVDHQVCQGFMAQLALLERQILQKDPALVGQNVSLTQIITITVNSWQRVFLYSRQILTEMVTNKRSSAEMMSILRHDVTVTGYSDVLELSKSCLNAAEQSWLIQVSCWILYGTLPHIGDFMLTNCAPDSGPADYQLIEAHIPRCIKHETAVDILDIGKCLASTRILSKSTKHTSTECARLLKTVQFPIDAAQFGGVVNDIKQLVFSGIIADNVSEESAQVFLYFIRQVVLLGSEEFSLSLLQLYSEQSLNVYRAKGSLNRLFNHAFNTMIEETINVEGLDEKLLQYESCFSVTSDSHKHDAFSELVFNIPCSLSFSFKWPYDILISETTLQNYSQIFNYLLTIRYIRFQIVAFYESHRRSERHSHEVYRLLFILKLLWDILWTHCQLVIDKSFKQTLDSLFSKNYQSVIDMHDQASSAILKDIIAANPDDSPANMSKLIRSLFIASTSFLQTLSRLPNQGDIYDAQVELLENLSKVPALIYSLSSLSRLTPEMTHLLIQLDPLAAVKLQH